MTPSDFGLPPQFSDYRQVQEDAILHTLGDEKRITAMCLPVGSGKTLCAATMAKHLGRTAILTSTLGLMSQYSQDFEPSGLHDIRGRSNYVCDTLGIPDCKIGSAVKCGSQRTGFCPYVQCFEQAKASEIVVTNYAYWMNVQNRGTGLGNFDCLILDEAHASVLEVSKYLDFVFREDEAEAFELPRVRDMGEDIEAWAAWAVKAEAQLKQKISTHRNPLQKAREEDRLEQLADRLKRMQNLNNDNWVIEKCEGHARWGRYWRFDCVWPGQYGEMLLQRIPRVIMMSGTLRPYTLGLLGIKKADYSFRAWPRVFPANRAPFYHINTARVKYGMPPEDVAKWLRTIDDIIEPRLGRKGIIHTVSYARQKLLQERSRFARYFVCNSNEPDSEAATEVVGKFKKSKAPAILVSPSMSTGWDFPYDSCEWAISTKIPFPDMTSKVMKRRKEMDDAYPMKMAAQELGQQLGRPMRAADDRAELFCVDDMIVWFKKAAAAYLPDGFAVTSLNEPPKPGPRWNEK